MLGQGEKVAVVALTDGFRVGGGREALAGVRADRLEHRQPRGAVWLPAAHEQALGDEAVERVEVGAGDRLRRLHRRAAAEDGEPRETRLARPRVSSSWLQSIVARSVCWRAGASRAPAPNARSAVSRRSAISAGDSSSQRAAASSIASGSPSTRRQISATAASLPSPSSNSGSCARARCAKSATASPSGGASASRTAVSSYGERRDRVALLGLQGERLAAGREHDDARTGPPARCR